MQLYLVDADLWDIVASPTPVASRDETWRKRNNRALLELFRGCDSDQQNLVTSETEAHAVWVKLGQIYQAHDASSILRLFNEFTHMEIQKNESVAQFIARVKSVSQQLTSAGEVISQTILFNRILVGLGPEYEAARSALDLVNNLTEVKLTSTLLNTEARLRESSTRSRRRSRSPTCDSWDFSRRRSRSPARDATRDLPPRSSSSAVVCSDCGRTGHSAASCWTTHSELHDQARAFFRDRRQDLRRLTASRPVAPPSVTPPVHYTQTAAFAEVMANLGWTRIDPSSRPDAGTVSSSSRPSPDHPPPSPLPSGDDPFPLPAPATTDTLWDIYDYGMVMNALDFNSLVSFRRHDRPMGLEENCFSLAAPPPSKVLPIHTDPPGRWLIDSGASNHYTSLRHILTDFHSIPDVQIMTGKGLIAAKGIGNITLHTSMGLRTVYDVMWVPELTGRHNLLSIPQLISKGCTIQMSSKGVRIVNHAGITLVTGSFTGKGFLVDMFACTSSMPRALLPESLSNLSGALVHHPGIAMLAGTEDTQPVEVWHMRLGHLNQAAIQSLTTRATGLRIGPARLPTISIQCDACLKGAQHKHISYIRSGTNRSKELSVLEHVWADLKGPLLDKDVFGYRYFAIFVNEKTRYMKVYPLLEKSDTFGAFRIYEARSERVTGAKIIHLHVDGGGEFMSDSFRSHCRDRGIAIFCTQPYSPEMNSIAERMMRTIIEHASAMLWAVGLTVGFWAAAVKTSVFLINRSPASALPGDITPYEAYFGNKPNLGFLRVWGCRAAAHVPDQLRSKTDWSTKSTECIFIGYSETENLFELWDIEKANIIRKRDVIFWENDLGHPKYAKLALPHGVSIYKGSTSTLVTPPDPPALSTALDSSAIPVSFPLSPRPVQQSIPKLPPEPTVHDRARAGELTFVHYQPLAKCMELCDSDVACTEHAPDFTELSPSVWDREPLELFNVSH